VIAAGDVGLGQHRDGHRAFALPVDLREPRAEPVERLHRILDIHRRAAIDDGADVVALAFRRALDQALHHGRGGEHRGARPGAQQFEYLRRLEAAGFRHDVDAAAHDMRHDVEPGAVAHRGRVQDRIAGRDRIHLGGAGDARGGEHLVREHRALRPPGGAGGVEQPGEIVGVARHDGDRVGREQPIVLRAADDDHALQTGRRVRSDLAVEPRRGKADARARLLEDVAELRAMQLGVGGNGGEPGMPDRIERFEIVRAVLGDDGDAIAGHKPKALQRTGEPRHPAGDLAVAPQAARAKAERRTLRVLPAGAFKCEREVHRHPVSRDLSPSP
jgi:hypothetical protein